MTKPPKAKKKPRTQIRTEVIMTRLTTPEMLKVDEICKLEKSNRADLVRFALKFFMESYALGNVDARESQLDRRLQQVDKHLSSLLVKAIKVSGQNLYWSMLPFTKGPPQRRLNEEGLQMLRDSALNFALAQLSAKQRIEEGNEEAAGSRQ